MAKRELTGKDAFIQYYQEIFSNPQEFTAFIEALETPGSPILRFHPQYAGELKKLWSQAGLPWETVDWYPYALKWPSSVPPKTELPGFKERYFYAMNASSLLPVLNLEPQPGENILDACAAPGGKALFIAETMAGSGELIANDISSFRRHRMKQIFDAYHHPWVQVWSAQAETIFRQRHLYFDKILLDSPCSSEKHIYNNPKELAKWSPSRVKGLKKRQYGLISGLLFALKPGGRLVYSTCAITPEENEQVVERVLKKRKDVELKPVMQTGPGSGALEPHLRDNPSAVRRVLPHRDNLDPMFVAVFEKKLDY